ncbi:MAG: FAD-dependent oxidoreductase [Chloroflexi bacterium]|nr:FAD-dependent oxidoreductase [Chloroflexota bacterium]
MAPESQKTAEISLTIDGCEIKAKRGTTVLQAAQQAGIYIPNLCAHPDLTPYGGCRLCVVEVDSIRSLPTACTTPVVQGMVVRTESEQITQVRRTALELILSEHPHVCLTCNRQKHCGPYDVCLRSFSISQHCVTCPKNERCELQNVARYIGLDTVRFGYTYRGLPVKTDDPLFTRDYNLCILCGRCVRACQELRGVGAIDFAHRGIQTVVSTPFDKPLVDSACKFCLACVEVCPTAALTDKGAERWETEAEREAFLVPCKHACPLKIDAPRYVRLISERKFAEALAVVAESTPFPFICGTVCHHPCEAVCRRGEVNEPISIMNLKRFIAERPPAGGVRRIKFVPPSGKRVAIVGSGPAGLTAAYYLARLRGHSVTVFESLPEPGGMLRVGIPEYRLPKAVLKAEIDLLRDSRVEIKTNSRVESLDELSAQGYNAVFLALGAHRGSRLGMDGENSPGVMDGVSFLREVNLGVKVKVGDRVAVVGGGNAAIDSARTASRLGAREVTIIYRRTRDEMPARHEEVDGALEEGIKIVFLAAPSKIARRDERLELTCVRMQLGEPDASGRRRPVAVRGSEFSMEFDTIIAAIGQVPEIPRGFDVELDKGGVIKVDPDTLATSKPGVFAGGDIVTGPATVTGAMAAGKKAAICIDRYLGGSGDISEALTPEDAVGPCLGREEDFARKPRQQMPCLEVSERTGNFSQVEVGLDETAAVAEAARCLKCDIRLRIGKARPVPHEQRLEEILASYAK